MRFLTFSYNQDISLKPAETAIKVIESETFQAVYPDRRLHPAISAKSYYKIQYFEGGRWFDGGYRFSSSVTGASTGLHGDINIVDDPLNPHQAASDADRKTANDFHEQTLPSRKTIKKVSVTILIMQRLHEDDPTGFLLDKKKLSIRHIRLPADISDPAYAELVSPPELKDRYVDGLLDPVRMDRQTLDDFEERLGQYGAAAQLGQNPAPPGGGMFDTDRMLIIDRLPPEVSRIKTVRAWDKAGTDPTKEKGTKEPAYTVGTRMSVWANGQFIVEDVVRGRWSAAEREGMILATAQADGQEVEIWVEQEPGSGGKESAEFTVRNLAGFLIRAERPVGNKVARADTFSVQVERYNVKLLKGDWNKEFLAEYGMFPNSKFKDQVDSGSMAFAKLAIRKEVWIGGRRR
jgi:predicted phage terminase large subunit-like protein